MSPIDVIAYTFFAVLFIKGICEYIADQRC